MVSPLRDDDTVGKAQVREQLVGRVATVIRGTPEEFLAFVRAESEKFGPVVKRAGIVTDYRIQSTQRNGSRP